ncbi:MAG TPA: PilZ domain-containing protein [Terriglobales bacterium]|nr:PilZ domain-containing protein [Terriglobales bacterium]
MPDQYVEPRVTVDLPVRVWGMTADGRPFSQHARAQNISSEGALLSGIESELKVGDIIGVQCDDRKTRCSVVWVMNTGAIKKNQVGVKLLADQECPWKSYLPIQNATVAVLSPSNRRRFPRHKISFPIELRDERVKTPMRINATDVSGNGCYVETILPLPVGTVLRVDFYLQSEHVNISAVVRTCDPGVGNGIEFTGLPPDGKQHLQGYLDGIDPQMGVSAPKTE